MSISSMTLWPGPPPAGLAGGRRHARPLRLGRRGADQPGSPHSHPADRTPRAPTGRRGQRGLDARHARRQTILAAVVGDDEEGRTVGQLLDNLEINRRLMLAVDDRDTTVKERLLGRAQHRYPHQMMRVDRESVAPVSAATAHLLLSGIARCMDEIDLVLVSDYDKGVCKGDMFPRLIELARAANVPVVADPVKDADYHRYAGCTCITPNRAEAGRALGTRITTPQEGLAAARKLLDFGVESVIVTLDKDGMAWVDRDGRGQLFPARPRQVCDITGAGDMVLSVLGYMLAAGADPAAAIETANVAGGLEVERLGVVPLTRREILNELGSTVLLRVPAPSPSSKLLSMEQLWPTLQRLRLPANASS